LLAEPASVAVTAPPELVPYARQTLNPVCPRAEHCSTTSLHESPAPLTPTTDWNFLVLTAARYS
jgi:hypothetical protein